MYIIKWFLIIVLIYSGGFTDCAVQNGYWRIQNGTPIDISEAPYTIQIRGNGSHHCGGTLVNVLGTQVVITAAHCLPPEFKFTYSIGAGSTFRNQGESRRVRKLVMHEGYSIEHYRDDIAIFFLDSPLETSEEIVMAELPYDYVDGKSPTPSELMVTGWGKTAWNSDRSEHLLSARMPLISNEECKRLYKGLESNQVPYNAISTNTLCLYLNEGGTTPCWGTHRNLYEWGCPQSDSGGPATAYIGGRYIHLGIILLGPGQIDPVNCSPKYPTVFTRVSQYIDWVEERVREDVMEQGGNENDSDNARPHEESYVPYPELVVD